MLDVVIDPWNLCPQNYPWFLWYKVVKHESKVVNVKYDVVNIDRDVVSDPWNLCLQFRVF